MSKPKASKQPSAALIAAAPDLLRVAQRLKAYLEATGDLCHCDHPDCKSKQLLDALKKAGVTP